MRDGGGDESDPGGARSQTETVMLPRRAAWLLMRWVLGGRERKPKGRDHGKRLQGLKRLKETGRAVGQLLSKLLIFAVGFTSPHPAFAQTALLEKLPLESVNLLI